MLRLPKEGHASHTKRPHVSRLLRLGLGALCGLVLLIAVTSNCAYAQAAPAHSVSLSWTASSDAASNPTLSYNTYRLNGACPAVAPTAISGSGFTKLNTAAITTTAYTDTIVTPGTYCYFASSFLASTESIPSNDAAGIIQPKPPTSLGVTSIVEMIQVTVPVDKS